MMFNEARERERFEAQARWSGWDTQRDVLKPDEYWSSRTKMHWEGWKARAMLEQEPAPASANRHTGRKLFESCGICAAAPGEQCWFPVRCSQCGHAAHAGSCVNVAPTADLTVLPVQKEYIVTLMHAARRSPNDPCPHCEAATGQPCEPEQPLKFSGPITDMERDGAKRSWHEIEPGPVKRAVD